MDRRPTLLTKDHGGGLLMIVLGAFVAVQGWGYHTGTLRRMGPGYIPLVLGVLLMAVGVAIALTPKAPASGLASGHAKGAHRPEWRGWLCICGGVFAFVVLGRYGGLVPASLASVFIAALGDRKGTVKGSLLLAIGLTLFGVAVFHFGLHLQLPLFTWG